MKKTLLRASSLTFAIVVTGFLVARAVGCTSSKPSIEPVSPTSSPPPVTPTTPGDPGNPGAPPFPAPSAPVDAGPSLSIIDPGNSSFMPATKSGMPFREPVQPTTQQAAPP